MLKYISKHILIIKIRRTILGSLIIYIRLMKDITYITSGATKFVFKGPLIAYFDDKVNLKNL